MRRDEKAVGGGRPDMDYHDRFDQLQTRFIDEPKEAVREASQLVRELVDRLLKGEQDTEQLRRVMQGHRDLMARIEGRDINGHGPAATATAPDTQDEVRAGQTPPSERPPEPPEPRETH